jgi:hypothetical protein
MTARIGRWLAHFFARRVASRLLRRFGLMRLLPVGLLPMLLAEALLMGVRQWRARPELRQRLWRLLSAGTPRTRPTR